MTEQQTTPADPQDAQAESPDFTWHDLSPERLFAFRESGGAVFCGCWKNYPVAGNPAAFAVAVASWNKGRPFYVKGFDLAKFKVRQLVNADGDPVGEKGNPDEAEHQVGTGTDQESTQSDSSADGEKESGTAGDDGGAAAG